ncbi:MAG TPA: hypothetical protein VL051_07500 [Burkholderiaceae bacterium]|nr:hypothetical protein [Burkholderiaceae bacterium]
MPRHSALVVCAPAATARRRAAGVLALMLMLAGSPSGFAQTDDVAAWAARHSAEKIQSADQAEQILREAETLRQQVEARYLAQQNACYDRFFVSPCLEQAAEQHRGALERIRPLEIKANVWKRRTKVEERDRNLELQRDRDQEEARQRAEQQRQRQAETAEKMQRKAQEGQAAAEKSRLHEGDADRRVAEHAARLKQQEQDDAAKAGERARNIAEYEQKRRDSEARQREIAADKAEKARQRAAKQNAAGAAPAAPAATVPVKP